MVRANNSSRRVLGPRRGFTLVELAVVVVIIAVLAAVAAPRLSAGADRARLRQVHANTVVLQRAIDLYTTEHDGLTPAHAPDGQIDPDVQAFVDRLLGRTDASGVVSPSGPLGPYLRNWPINPLATCAWVRLNGPLTPQGCSWRFRTDTGRLGADHTSGEPCIFAHQASPPTPPDLGGQSGPTVPTAPTVPGGTGNQMQAPAGLEPT